MMAITHACIATAGMSLILGTANPVTLCLAILGSQLSDIDTDYQCNWSDLLSY